MVICGKEKPVVEKWFENCKQMGIAAEHGFFYRLNTEKTASKTDVLESQKWELLLK